MLGVLWCNFKACLSAVLLNGINLLVLEVRPLEVQDCVLSFLEKKMDTPR